MKKYVKVNRTEANKQVDLGHISLTQQINVNSLPRSDFNKDKRNWTDFKYRIIKSSIAKGDFDKLFNQNSMQIDKVIKETPLDFLTPRPKDIIIRPATAGRTRKKSSARETSKVIETKRNSTKGNRKNSKSIKSKSGGSVPRLELPKESSLEPEQEIKLLNAEKQQIEGPEVRLDNLNSRKPRPGDKLKRKVKTIMNAFKFKTQLPSEEIQPKFATGSRAQLNSIMPQPNDKSPSSRLSGSRFGPDAFNLPRKSLRPSNSIALTIGVNAAEKSFREDGTKSKASPLQRRPIMNEVLPNREKRNSLKSISIQQVDSDSIKDSSMHSGQNPDTKIIILHTDDKEAEKSIRAQKSQRILNQSFISRQKLGTKKPKSGIVNEIEENSHYRNVASTHQFIRSFFASLNFVLRSPLFGAFKKIKNHQLDTLKPSVMQKLKRQNSMELVANTHQLDSIFGPSIPKTHRNKPISNSILETSQKEERRNSLRKDGSLFVKLFPVENSLQPKPVKQLQPMTPAPRMSIRNIRYSLLTSSRRRGSHRNLTTGMASASLLLSAYASKIPRFNFMARDSEGASIKLSAESYILDDFLNKDKFFVAFKFLDNTRKIWGRTRISLSCDVIHQAQVLVRMKEWQVLRKALETAVPAVKLIPLLPEPSATGMFLAPDYNHLMRKETEVTSKITTSIFTFFVQKFCVIKRINGEGISYLNSNLKKLFLLKNYFKDRYGKKVLQLKREFINLVPMFWIHTQKKDSRYYRDADGIGAPDTYADYHEYLNIGNLASKHPNHLRAQEFQIQITKPEEDSAVILELNKIESPFKRETEQPQKSKKLELFLEPVMKLQLSPLLPTPQSQKSRRTSFTATAKAFVKFKNQQKINAGWANAKFEPKPDEIMVIKPIILSIFIKHDNRYWLNIAEIELAEDTDINDDIFEDFRVKLTQMRFPFKTDRVWIASTSLNELQVALGMPRASLLKFISARLCGTRITSQIFDRFFILMSEFLSSLHSNRKGNPQHHQERQEAASLAQEVAPARDQHAQTQPPRKELEGRSVLRHRRGPPRIRSAGPDQEVPARAAVERPEEARLQGHASRRDVPAAPSHLDSREEPRTGRSEQVPGQDHQLPDQTRTQPAIGRLLDRQAREQLGAHPHRSEGQRTQKALRSSRQHLRVVASQQLHGTERSQHHHDRPCQGRTHPAHPQPPQRKLQVPDDSVHLQPQEVSSPHPGATTCSATSGSSAEKTSPKKASSATSCKTSSARSCTTPTTATSEPSTECRPSSSRTSRKSEPSSSRQRPTTSGSSPNR